MNVSICLVIANNEVNNTDVSNGTYYYTLLSQQFDVTSSTNPEKCVQWTMSASTGRRSYLALFIVGTVITFMLFSSKFPSYISFPV